MENEETKKQSDEVENVSAAILKTAMDQFDRIPISPTHSLHVITMVARVANEPNPGTNDVNVHMTMVATRHGVERDYREVRETGRVLLQRAIEEIPIGGDESEFDATMNALILAERAGISDQCRTIGGIKNPGKKEGRDQN